MDAYNIIVVGNGLLGSAAGRYLSQWDQSVAIVGSDEPSNHSTHDGVYSSHYDQGRLTRKYSQDPVWAVVSSQATQNYTMLETKSGITFHSPVGRLHASRTSTSEKVTDDSSLVDWIQQVDPAGEHLLYHAPDDRSWQDEFPYLNFPKGYGLFREGAPAGYVNPREMLRAQNIIAQQQGARLVAEQVVGVESTPTGAIVELRKGVRLVAQKVLIACGAFTNFNNLLPSPIPLRLKTETMIWADVDSETAKRLKNMPGVGYDIADPDIDDIYVAPPIRYPDGTFKIKMGCNTKGELWPISLAELQDWFRDGPSDVDLPPMERALRSILPKVEFGNIASHRCIVTYTPSGYPTIDRVPSDPYNRLFVATGGNGSGAGGADTLGHLAAGLVYDGRWIDELPREVFLATNQWGENKKVLTKAQERAAKVGQ